MTQPPTSIPHPLSTHLLHSLLTQTCTDITVTIPQWNRSYDLHRVVLVQAGFFHSLFCAGFSEGRGGDDGGVRLAERKDEGRGGSKGEKEVVVGFDDPNITRAAFEICISRLYSSYPTLQLYPSFHPTIHHPLTRTFPHPPRISTSTRSPHSSPFAHILDPHNHNHNHTSSSFSSKASHPHPGKEEPDQTHLLTPSSLLSLLCTAVYLGLNPLIQECVGLILGSVGPWSVGAYLGFALGDGAGLEGFQSGSGVDAGWAGGEGVWGLEGISREVGMMGEARGQESGGSAFVVEKKEAEDEETRMMAIKQEMEDETDHPMKCSATSTARSDLPHHPNPTQPHPNEPTLASSARSVSSSHRYTHDRLKFFYGPVGDKIGEACMAWLARWAVDLLDVEEGFVELQDKKKRAGSGSGSGSGSGPGAGAGADIPAGRASGKVTFDRNADEEDGSTVGRKGRGLSSSLPESTGGRRTRSVSWQPDLSVGSSSSSTASRSRGAAGTSRGQPDSIDARLRSAHVKFSSMSGSISHQQPSGSHGQASPAKDPGQVTILPPLKIWGHGGLPAAIVRGVISSDALFISDEVERYAFAKRVIALRQDGRERAREAREAARNRERGDGEGGAALVIRTSTRSSRTGRSSSDAEDDVGMGRLHIGVKEEEEDREDTMGDESFEEEEELLREEEDDEDAELNDVFRSGIYYSHMSFDELSSMSSDINPTTGLPYVPLPVLQAALWAASDVQTRITSYRPDGTTSAQPAGGLSTFNLNHPRAQGVPTRLKARATSGSGSSTDAGLVVTTLEIAEEIDNMTRTMSPRRSNRFTGGASSPRIMSGRQSPAMASPVRPTQMGMLGGGPSSSGATGMGPFCSPMERYYWPVPVDGTLRIGDSVVGPNGFVPASPLPDFGPQAPGNAVGMDSPTAFETGVQIREPHSDDKFFGFGSTRRTGVDIYSAYKDRLSSEVKEEALWSKYEPFRFAVEFWGVDQLGEKERAYSSTQFYAGSYFNIYVQTVKRKDKGVQLGIYLHRQTMLEPIPAASRPLRLDERGRRSNTDAPTLRWSDSSPAISSLPPGHSMVRNPDHTLAMYRTMSVTPVPGSTVPMQRTGSNAIGRSVSPPGGIGSDDELALDEVEGGGETPPTRQTRGESHSKNSPASPYRDPRKTAKVWFAVSCASAMGTALTRFSSGPDMFTVSQSWGWKSSSLRSQEYLSSSSAGDEDKGTSTGMPSYGERLDDGVLGWMSETMDDEEFKKKNLRSLRATVCMGVM